MIAAFLFLEFFSQKTLKNSSAVRVFLFCSIKNATRVKRVFKKRTMRLCVFCFVSWPKKELRGLHYCIAQVQVVTKFGSYPLHFGLLVWFEQKAIVSGLWLNCRGRGSRIRHALNVDRQQLCLFSTKKQKHSDWRNERTFLFSFYVNTYTTIAPC